MTMQDIYNRLRNDVQSDLPTWSPRDTDPISVTLEATATQLALSFLYFNARERAAFVQYATGVDLDALGLSRDVARMIGETDTQYRRRIIDALASIQPVGSVDYIQAQARNAIPNVAQVVVQPDYSAGTVAVYVSAGA